MAENNGKARDLKGIEVDIPTTPVFTYNAEFPPTRNIYAVIS